MCVGAELLLHFVQQLVQIVTHFSLGAHQLELNAPPHVHQIEIDYRCASNGILALTQSFPPSCSHQRIRTKVSNKQRLFGLKKVRNGGV